MLVSEYDQLEAIPKTAHKATKVSKKRISQPQAVYASSNYSTVSADVPATVFCKSHGNSKSIVRSNASLGRRMAAQKGWTGYQWTALLELWSCESSWSNKAQNPNSTAFGIAQFLDSTWRLQGLSGTGCNKSYSAEVQIRCGLEYIRLVYGSPAQALSFHHANNWY